MTAHKHAELIKAKADNMELVVFVNEGTGWSECLAQFPEFFTDSKYFLCLPQHKEACLHWLNGGDVGYYHNGNFIKYDLSVHEPKYPLEDFTGLEFDFVIKPRKEKRWIAVHAKSAKVEMFFDEVVCDNCMSEPMYKGCQKIEIEVEV